VSLEATSNILAHVASNTYHCSACGLCTTRNNPTPGEGNPYARIMFIGEAPGQEEDLQGLPFVGRSGELLDEALNRAQLPREYVFITNVVKCRPPGNRNPSKGEMEVCSSYLYTQIDAIRPELIVTLGKIAAEFLLQREVRITKENGLLDFWEDSVCLMTVYHPAYVLRNRQPEVKEAFFQAIQYAKEIAYGTSVPAHDRPPEENIG